MHLHAALGTALGQTAARRQCLHQVHAALDAELARALYFAVDVGTRRTVDVNDVAVLHSHVQIGPTGLQDFGHVDAQLDRRSVARTHQGDDVGSTGHHAACHSDHF